jgi:hypothetical protein
MPGPLWLSRWVRVNSKHVAFVADGTIEEGDLRKKEKSYTTESTAPSGMSQQDQCEAEASSSAKGDRKHRRSFFQKTFSLEKHARAHSAVMEAPPLGSVPGGEEVCGDARAHRNRSCADQAQQHRRQSSQQITEDSDSLNAIALALSFLPHPFFNVEQQQQHEHRGQILELESKLIAALDDLDYMRDLALEAPRADPQQEHSEPRKESHLEAASKQLHEVTTRHKEQVDELTADSVSRVHEVCAVDLCVDCLQYIACSLRF